MKPSDEAERAAWLLEGADPIGSLLRRLAEEGCGYGAGSIARSSELAAEAARLRVQDEFRGEGE